MDTPWVVWLLVAINLAGALLVAFMLFGVAWQAFDLVRRAVRGVWRLYHLPPDE